MYSDKIKEILDRECYEKWHAKRCQQRDENLLRLQFPCWICSENTPLAAEILDVALSKAEL